MKALFLLLAEMQMELLSLLSSCLVYCGSLTVNNMKEMHFFTIAVIIFKLLVIRDCTTISAEVSNVQEKKSVKYM